MRRAVTPFLPAALVLLWTVGAGTFIGGADAAWTVAGHLSLLAVVAMTREEWRDPLSLGGGKWLLVLLLLAGILSWYRSPVPRAGQVALLLAPAFLLIPRWTARCWEGETARRRGVAALVVAAVLVAPWSIVAGLILRTDGASLPLGHHNLLAAWLILVLPFTLLPWKQGGCYRFLTPAALLPVLLALLATGSLGGWLGLLAVVVLLRSWPWTLAAGAVLAALARYRLAEIGGGTDASALARYGYLDGGWRAWFERPWLGWGPGASRWTLSRFLEPAPGIRPADEVVADVHCWPLTIAGELGLVGLGLAVAVAAAFAWRHRRAPAENADRHLHRAAFVALGGFFVTSCLGRPQTAPVLFVLALVAMGAVLAVGPPRPTSSGRPLVVVALLLAFLLAPIDRAHLAWDRARDAENNAARLAQIRKAVRLDPALPLYAWYLAFREDAPEDALAAARSAGGLAPLWLGAGVLGAQAGEPWAEEALSEACRLNPLGAVAPWRLTLLRGDASTAARALLAEPRLLAADKWTGNLREEAARLLERRSGVDAQWRVEILQRAAEIQRLEPEPGADVKRRYLALTMDGGGATSLALHAFRRLPWPVEIDRIALRSDLLAAADLVAAAALDSTDASLFTAPDCR